VERGKHPNSQANLKPPFTADNQPEGRGRKKSKVKEFTLEYELTYDDVTALAKYVLSMSEKEIKEKALDKEAPMILRLFCQYLMMDMKKGVATNINMLLERAVGKVANKVDLQGDIMLAIDGDDAELG
jgi:hypothetical protein